MGRPIPSRVSIISFSSPPWSDTTASAHLSHCPPFCFEYRNSWRFEITSSTSFVNISKGSPALPGIYGQSMHKIEIIETIGYSQKPEEQYLVRPQSIKGVDINLVCNAQLLRVLQHLHIAPADHILQQGHIPKVPQTATSRHIVAIAPPQITSIRGEFKISIAVHRQSILQRQR